MLSPDKDGFSINGNRATKQEEEEEMEEEEEKEEDER